MPKRGGVYKYGGVERTPALLGAFADEACRAIPPATSVPPRLSPSQSVANAVATSLVDAVGVEAAGAVGGAAQVATPFVLAGAGIALFVSTALKFVEVAFGPGRRRDARGEPLRGSAQTAAARLDAAGFGEPAPVGPPPLTTASGEPIAPAAAARSSRRRRRRRRSARDFEGTNAPGERTTPPSRSARPWKNSRSGSRWWRANSEISCEGSSSCWGRGSACRTDCGERGSRRRLAGPGPAPAPNRRREGRTNASS